jgi:ssDNA-binding replication factor A large subunit
VTFWNKHTQPIEDQEFDEGDILRVINGRVRTGLRDQLEIHLGVGSRIMINPPDVDSKDFPDDMITLSKINTFAEGMNDVHTEVNVVAKYRVTTFSRGDSDGTVASLAIRDDTGQTRLVLWDEQSEWFNKLSLNDSIRIESGYVRLDRNNEPELHLGRRGRIKIISSAPDQSSSVKPSLLQNLKDLNPGDFAGAIGVVVLENQGLSTFTRRDGREGKRLVFILADKTGKVRSVAWGQAAERLADVDAGTILLVEGASCRSGLRQELEIHINESTQVIQNPPNLEIPKPSDIFLMGGKSDAPHQVIANIIEGNFVTVRGTIVQVIHQKSVYDSCPSCFKKVSISNSTISCPKCGEIPQSEPRLIAKIIIDDGTENIRASLIGTSAEKLFGISAKEAKKLIEKSGNEDEPVRRVEDTLLGKEVNLSGRISLNNFSNELEISVNEISDVNALETIKQLMDIHERKVKR